MLDNNTDRKFQSEGSLYPPGPIGKLIRLILGIGCLYFVWQIISLWQSMVESKELFTTGSFVFMTLFGFYLSPYVINRTKNIRTYLSWAAA